MLAVGSAHGSHLRRVRELRSPCARGAQPYLGARTQRSGDKMIDGVLVPRGVLLAAARSVEAAQVASILAAGLVREPVANIFVTMG